MATIALYANKVNQMPGLIKNVKKSVTNYKSELSKLRKKTLSVDSKVCNMDDIIGSIQSSTQTQEQKIQFLDKVARDSEQFIRDTATIDRNVADVVQKRKEDFYEKYYYLKPECEKSRWEKVKDCCKKVGEWCREHWKAIVTAVIVIAAVIVIVAFPALSPLLLLVAKGALSGAVIGGLMGGTMSLLTGGSFWEGFENGAFTGAIMGAIGGAGGAVGQLLAGSCKALKIMAVTFKLSTGITAVMGGFDLLSLGIGLFDPNNPLVQLNHTLHNNVLYNGVQFLAGAAAAFSGGAYLQMKKYPCTCFVAGTMILTASGLVAIENIKAGDKVIATNPVTFHTEEKTVVETYQNKATELLRLIIHGEEIMTTMNHPFYVENQGFIPANRLCVGDRIVNAATDSYTVESVDVVEKQETVYNFEVEDFHTYYVGKSGVLVHNDCGGSHELVSYGTDDIASYEYNMIENPGPLAEIEGNPAKNFFGTRYNAEVLTEDRIYYRGGNSENALGQWFTREPPESIAKVRVDTAVKPQWIDPITGELTGESVVDTVYAVKIPKGATVYEGPVGPQGGAYCGGFNVNQTFIKEPWKLDYKVISKKPLY